MTEMTDGEFAALLDEMATVLPDAIEGAASARRTIDPRPRGVSLSELRAGPAPSRPDFVVYDLIPTGGVGVITGEPKIGKSWHAMHLAMCIASGKPAHEAFSVMHPRTVFYATEDGPEMVKPRCLAIAAGLGLPVDAPWAKRFYVATGESIDLCDTARLCVLAASVRRAEQEAGVKVGLIVIDPVRLRGDDRTEAREASAAMRALGRVLECTVVGVYQKPKTFGRPPANPGRGSIHDVIDFGIHLERPRGDGQTEFTSKASCELKTARGAGAVDLSLRIEDDARGFAQKAVFRAMRTETTVANPTEERAAIVVRKLHEHNAPMTFEDLKRAIGGGTDVFRRALEFAEVQGWVSRRIHNGRKAGYEITDAGRELVRTQSAS